MSRGGAKRQRTAPAWPLPPLRPLSSADELHFAEKGWVRLQQAFDRRTAEICHSFMWGHLGDECGLRRDDPSTWNTEALLGSNGLNKKATHPVFQGVSSVRLLSAAEQVNGGKAVLAPKSLGSFLVTFPRHILGSPHLQPQQWKLPRNGTGTGWHWDGNPAAWMDTDAPGVKVFTLFSDIAKRGGGTLLLEGSPLLIDRFFQGLSPEERTVKQNPLRKRFDTLHPWIRKLVAPSEGDEDSDTARIAECMEGEPTIVDGVPLRVVECVGDAGDAFLVHPSMYHSSSPNCATTPRFMRSTHMS